MSPSKPIRLAMNAMPFVFALLLTTMASTANAQTLDNAIDEIADKVAKYLTDKGVNQIEVGSFDAGSNAFTGGRHIQELLIDRLQSPEHGIKVPDFGAQWKVRGKISFEVKDDIAKLLLAVEIVDRKGKEQLDFRKLLEKDDAKSREINNIEDMIRVLGLTPKFEDPDAGDPPNEAPTAEEFGNFIRGRLEALKGAIDKPNFVAMRGTKTIIASQPSSKFGIELFVKHRGDDGFTPIPIVNRSGFAFAPLREGDIYRVRVYNETDGDIGVKLVIDGINCFKLSRNLEFKKLGVWVVRAGKVGDIAGWYVDARRVHEFKVARTQPEGLPDEGRIGTITALFFHALDPDAKPPRIEALAGTDMDLTTIPGLEIDHPTQTVKRKFGKQVLDAISVRYRNPIPPPGQPAAPAVKPGG
jgi:hypothetical protein